MKKQKPLLVDNKKKSLKPKTGKSSLVPTNSNLSSTQFKHE